MNSSSWLMQADAGVAMGLKGTEAAKRAGAIVLADDNFSSITHAVAEGRTGCRTADRRGGYRVARGTRGGEVAAQALDALRAPRSTHRMRRSERTKRGPEDHHDHQCDQRQQHGHDEDVQVGLAVCALTA